MPAPKVVAGGPTGYFAKKVDLTPAPPATFRDEWWRSLAPEEAWRILQGVRAAKLFPADSADEYLVYFDLLRRSRGLFSNQVFMGVQGGGTAPVFMSRAALMLHGYILGTTGSGKSTQAIANLLFHLTLGHDNGTEYEPPPAVLVVDAKPDGRGPLYLSRLTQMLSNMRSRFEFGDTRNRFQFLTTNTTFASASLDPLAGFRGSHDPHFIVETMMLFLGLVYDPGYGSDYFTATQRHTALRAVVKLLKNRQSAGAFTLKSFLAELKRAVKSIPDAVHFYRELDSFGMSQRVQLGDEKKPTLDFDRLLEERGFMYLHIDAMTKPLGRQLSAFALLNLHLAQRRRRIGGLTPAKVFVFIDEFHMLACQPLVDWLTTARDNGIHVILSHQAPESLPKTMSSGDLFARVFRNCGFTQLYNVEHPTVLESLRNVAGERIRILNSESHTHSVHCGFSNWSSTTDCGQGTATGWTDSTGRTRREEYVSRLDPETVRRVHSTGRWFLLHVKEEPGDSVTPLGGVPTAVEGLFPLRKAAVDEMSAGTWPKAPPEDDEPGDEPEAPKRKGPPRKPKSPGTGRTDEDLKDAFAAAAG